MGLFGKIFHAVLGIGEMIAGAMTGNPMLVMQGFQEEMRVAQMQAQDNAINAAKKAYQKQLAQINSGNQQLLAARQQTLPGQSVAHGPIIMQNNTPNMGNFYGYKDPTATPNPAQQWYGLH